MRERDPARAAHARRAPAARRNGHGPGGLLPLDTAPAPAAIPGGLLPLDTPPAIPGGNNQGRMK